MLLVTGGTDYLNLDSTEIFDPSLGIWKAGAALPSPWSSPKAATVANRILIFGIDILFAKIKLS